jgi:hypothetical protein
MDTFGALLGRVPFNQDAPNPFFGRNGRDELFRFRDLLVQGRLAALSWPYLGRCLFCQDV